MTDRWFLWGLSNGVFVLAIAGGFWFGLAASALRPSPATAFVLIVEAALLWGAFHLRRRARGFRLSEAKNGDDRQQRLLRQMVAGFWTATIAQALGITLAVGICVVAHRVDFIWPAIGLLVSLHFAPLARVFHVPPYYALSVAGSGASLLAAFDASGPGRIVLLGLTLGTATWLTAAYLLLRADHLARAAIRELAEA